MKSIFENWKIYLLLSIIAGLLIPELYKFVFVADDLRNLHAALNNPFPVSGDWIGAKVHLFRPLIILSFWLNYHITGFNPSIFYLVNLIMHLLNTFIIFKILLFINPGSDKNNWQNLVFSVIFLVIPQNLQNVLWISGRTDLLCGLFVFASVYYLIRFYNEGNKIFLTASLATQVLAYLSKESALVILFYLPLLFLIRREYLHTALKKWFSSVLIFLPSAAYAIYRLIIFTDNPFGIRVKSYNSIYQVVRFFIDSLWTLFVPFDASDITYFRAVNPLSLNLMFGIILILIIAAAYFLFENRKDSKIKLLVGVFLLTLASQSIYLKIWPAMRLVYPFSLFILSCFFITFSAQKHYKWLRITIIVVYFIMVAAGDMLLINRTITINQSNKKFFASLPDKMDGKRNYYVIGRIGLLGQSWASPESNFMAWLKINPSSGYLPGNFLDAGAFDGYSLSNPEKDLFVKVISPDSIFLKVNNNHDFLVPEPTEIFPPSGEYVYRGKYMKLKLLTKRKNGERASSCLLILDDPANSEIIVVK